jgi:hypothetical protein
MICWIICLPEIMVLCGAVALAVWLADAHKRGDVWHSESSHCKHVCNLNIIARILVGPWKTLPLTGEQCEDR